MTSSSLLPSLCTRDRSRSYSQSTLLLTTTISTYCYYYYVLYCTVVYVPVVSTQ